MAWRFGLPACISVLMFWPTLALLPDLLSGIFSDSARTQRDEQDQRDQRAEDQEDMQLVVVHFAVLGGG